MTTQSNETSSWKVYIHTCLITGWKYVGITYHDDPNVRWKNGNGYPHNTHFSSAIKKYGWDNFSHVIIAEGLTKHEANKIEEEHITKFKKLGICYNITDGGEGHNGQPLPEEVRAKISATLKAKQQVPWNKGKTGVYTEETRYAMGASFRGKVGPNKGKKLGPMTAEQRAKLSEAHKGLNTWSKGSKRGPYSEEHRKHISEALIGKRKGISTGPRTDDTKAKISATRKGYKWVSKPWEPPKQVPPTELESYLNSGWSLGKLIIHNDEVYKWDKQSSSWQIYVEARKEVLLKKQI